MLSARYCSGESPGFCFPSKGLPCQALPWEMEAVCEGQKGSWKLQASHSPFSCLADAVFFYLEMVVQLFLLLPQGFSAASQFWGACQN